MGRKSSLNEFEKGQIDAFKKNNLSNRLIAKNISRSEKVVRNYLKNPQLYGSHKSTGRPAALTDREKRAILRTASNFIGTARQIALKAGVNAKICNVRKVLRESDNIQIKKLQRKPQLLPNHKDARLRFAKEHMSWKKKWQRVIFSDEKKFNMDGPDGWQYYFHDLRKEPLVLSRRQQGGGSLMVWGAIGYGGRTELKFISGHINSNRYKSMLAETLPVVGAQIGGPSFIFQQDNAAVHTAGIVNDWFTESQIPVLKWPARSPDLNIIENMWGELSRAVYAEGRQYSSVHELKASVQREWANISNEYVQNLYKSMPNRIFEVIKNNGGNTKY